MKIITPVAILFLSSFIAHSGESAKSGILNCRDIAKSFGYALKEMPIETVIKMLSKEVSTNPHCSCELIKTAIAIHKPTPRQVTVLVDTAIHAAPDHIEEIVNCSIAAAPDSKSGILDTASDYGYTPNPLDYPGIAGEHPGGPWQYIPNTPVIVIPPQVTQVDP